jgi:hypothetical protein
MTDIDTLWQNYAACEAANVTGAGAVALFRMCDQGNPRAMAIKAWIDNLYAECYTKEAALLAGQTVDLTPSEPWKPYSFRDAAAEAAGLIPPIDPTV